MGLASNQARLNVLTIRKSDLECQLMILSGREMSMATKKSEAINKKNTAMQNFINDSDDKNANFNTTQAYLEYEAAMDELEAAEIKLDQQKELAQTEHTAVTAEEDEIKKLIKENIKTSFGYFN